jgi:HlyD family secretion protein|tara:strand:- start:5960 stop:7072 length:1113 start_codon:yes stop_codon:yes gene_type:complete
MSKRARIILIGIVILFIGALIWFGKKNAKSLVAFETESPFRTSIIKKTVATGKVIPLEEIEIKPQIAGIIDKVVLLEGSKVKKGDLIAVVRVVPNEQSLISAKGRVDIAKLRVNNSRVSYQRTKILFEKGVVASAEYEGVELSYAQATQDLKNAENDYLIIKRGSAGSSGAANTNIIAQMSGTILEIPVKEGDQVIQSNNFNAGTTIASIADMSKMIFEGKVDESEVGKLVKGTEIEVSIGAIEGKKFLAKLNFIAPKGTEEGGAVQFKIKADISLDDKFFIRAGYSANADIILVKKDSVLAIKEGLLRFEKETETPYVEVETTQGVFEKKMLELGTSDGVNVEIIKGVVAEDKIKVWNKASKKEEEEDK